MTLNLTIHFGLLGLFLCRQLSGQRIIKKCLSFFILRASRHHVLCPLAFFSCSPTYFPVSDSELIHPVSCLLKHNVWSNYFLPLINFVTSLSMCVWVLLPAALNKPESFINNPGWRVVMGAAYIDKHFTHLHGPATQPAANRII